MKAVQQQIRRPGGGRCPDFIYHIEVNDKPETGPVFRPDRAAAPLPIPRLRRNNARDCRPLANLQTPVSRVKNNSRKKPFQQRRKCSMGNATAAIAFRHSPSREPDPRRQPTTQKQPTNRLPETNRLFFFDFFFAFFAVPAISAPQQHMVLPWKAMHKIL